MDDKNAESIKSLEAVNVCWIEEAQMLTKRSLDLLRPTIRADGSEIWATWNPTRKSDAIDVFLRQKKPDNAIVVEANWKHNPFFPQVLDEERLLYRRAATPEPMTMFGRVVMQLRHSGISCQRRQCSELEELRNYKRPVYGTWWWSLHRTRRRTVYGTLLII